MVKWIHLAVCDPDHAIQSAAWQAVSTRCQQWTSEEKLAASSATKTLPFALRVDGLFNSLCAEGPVIQSPVLAQNLSEGRLPVAKLALIPLGCEHNSA